jgi:hypothetical protein
VKVYFEMPKYTEEKTKAGNRNAKLKEVGMKRTDIQRKERRLMTEILSKTMTKPAPVDRLHWDTGEINMKGISEV